MLGTEDKFFVWNSYVISFNNNNKLNKVANHFKKMEISYALSFKNKNCILITTFLFY